MVWVAKGNTERRVMLGLFLSFAFLSLMGVNIMILQGRFDDTKDEVENLICQIAKENVLTGETLGFTGEMSEQYIRYEKLNSIATNEDLIKLTNHPNPVVRCYAFQTLAGRENVDIFSIMKNHLNDNEELNVRFGCKGGKVSLKQFWWDTANSKRNVNKLTTQQKDELRESFK